MSGKRFVCSVQLFDNFDTQCWNCLLLLALKLFWNCAFMRASLQNIWSAMFYIILCHLVTFCLKWWDRWVPQSILLRNPYLTRPVFTPTLICTFSLALEALIQPFGIFTPKYCWKKIFPAAVFKWIVGCQFAFVFTLVPRKAFVLRDVAFTFSLGYLDFTILLVRVSGFYRSLC